MGYSRTSKVLGAIIVDANTVSAMAYLLYDLGNAEHFLQGRRIEQA